MPKFIPSIAAFTGAAALTAVAVATAPSAAAQGTAYATYNCAGNVGDLQFDRDSAGYLYVRSVDQPPVAPSPATLDLYFGFGVVHMRNDVDPYQYASPSPTPAVNAAPYQAVVKPDGVPVQVTCSLVVQGPGFPI